MTETKKERETETEGQRDRWRQSQAELCRPQPEMDLRPGGQQGASGSQVGAALLSRPPAQGLPPRRHPGFFFSGFLFMGQK